MSRVKSRNSAIELVIRKSLFYHGLRYRIHTKLHGCPDISIKKYKLVVFVDSCFWHGCPVHLRLPKTNKEYWIAKIARNVTRDLDVNNFYDNIGWKVFRIWEHDIQKVENFCDNIKAYVDSIRIKA
jgi:DNA mismatch endonuclease (patch repair protein)